MRRLGLLRFESAGGSNVFFLVGVWYGLLVRILITSPRRAPQSRVQKKCKILGLEKPVSFRGKSVQNLGCGVKSLGFGVWTLRLRVHD